MTDTGTQPAPAAPRRRRRYVVVAIVAVLLAAVVIVHILRQKKPAPVATAQVVTVATATLGPMPEMLSELGTITPVATVTVLPQLSGYLVAVGYREGQDVVKGQFLAQIDPRQYEISKRQAEAQLAKDQAALAQARADLARYTQLNERHSIAEQTYTDQRFLVQQDEAAVKADEANIAQFALDLEYCRITAPVSGRVGLRLVDPGNYVTASSQPGIAVITTMKPTTVEFSVPQNALGRVLQRFNAGARLPVDVYSSDNSRRLATGTLYAINNQMATATGTVTLRATVPNDDEALFPNEFVNVKLQVDTLQNAVLVPTPAVQTGAPGDYVYLVNANDTVSVHKVTPGPGDGRHTVIVAGLAAGDRVVTDGMDRLSDGAKIRAVAASAASAPSTASAPPAAGAEREPAASGPGAPAPATAPAAASNAS
ncbi:efflux RND transporter periplasmic adaptor subunit [Paraburkholderia caballeronis]|uniref:Membrane fusion protein, multidrug efflux system n=1 Tax=Paraburkholderia caballeronis TaxID=416943 RepID=A0A1H7RHN9_9BURK|nr:efflux RND transporter periplasmic adaptor subunit [Paraburkholderia caballeronis]PXW23034.1 multidrug efflux system membrane fusion protein [Paraburkholderia caballeronis]PXW97698.1 multidrug efflux system membrane fusion protein [Paraburkholderia caballeronis]RAJ94668.1 multidrug efflux system membrane fusion protein [Paraburkholderia caballeronis]TDV11788.1 multidrug efflux system membrane fusion protein [Paraburkholderia caballeronis]TDV14869.1 multidrug efflux system membrane fusion pr